MRHLPDLEIDGVEFYRVITLGGHLDVVFPKFSYERHSGIS